MVFTLQRYIFRELLKVFTLAAVALTLMLSLGSILRPIQEYGAGPTQAHSPDGLFPADYADLYFADGGTVRRFSCVRPIRV